ncbi:MAG TPA: hypothetical protein VFO10_02535 [Oligoflexus sp.]|uniref:hypothetical protein n=1 Tax=Oligoflexus sp. TaxID=1971216 RepID=UPI002D8029DF|nr:hypothetical protein [Oligoflexus sp.]HET9236098.1 hypothetical protein [Oligoflexus sp.]
MFLEIDALRKLYALDRVAHFTFLFSDLALDEISRIKSIIKQNTHSSLLDRLIEHRHDVYLEEGRNGIAVDRDRCFATFSSMLPEKMHNDGRQYAESVVVEADYFLTNDEKFLRRLPGISSVIACRPSKLAFLNRN